MCTAANGIAMEFLTRRFGTSGVYYQRLYAGLTIAICISYLFEKKSVLIYFIMKKNLMNFSTEIFKKNCFKYFSSYKCGMNFKMIN